MSRTKRVVTVTSHKYWTVTDLKQSLHCVLLFSLLSLTVPGPVSRQEPEVQVKARPRPGSELSSRATSSRDGARAT